MLGSNRTKMYVTAAFPRGGRGQGGGGTLGATMTGSGGLSFCTWFRVGMRKDLASEDT